MSKNVIITGGTGMVGLLVLKECLENDNISSVTSLVREKSNITHPKLKEVVIEDFCDYSNHGDLFRNKDIAYYCLGVYTGAVPRDEFRKITVDFTIAFADKLREQSPNAGFVFLSGAGADRAEKSRMMFAKDKGAAENYLLKKDFKALHIFRPGYIYPVTPRKEPNFSYILSRKLYPILKVFIPGSVIESVDLAHAMFSVGVNGGKMDTYENKDIRNLIQ